MFYDKYGRENLIDQQEPEPYKIDEQDGVTYICYFDTAERAIRKITKEGTVTTIEVAFGAWDDRATLEYVPVNTPLEVY